ncbi:MAG: putative membrane protein [Oceanicaulis sp. HLUCCA04]|nr:MAG: putative membrane protein [Oceanicaulis sp. HLUCCA04]
MSDVDRLIEQALDDEDRVLREALGREPGFVASALGLLKGPRAWARWVMFVSQTIMFVAGVWLAWEFFQAEDVLEALRYGLPSTVLMLGSLVMKTGMTPFMTENRLVTEIRRLELRIERMRAERG